MPGPGSTTWPGVNVDDGATHVPASGFYVDIGAGQPGTGSITDVLYSLGWSGLNAAAPDVAAVLRKRRARDTSIDIRVGSVSGTVRLIGPSGDTVLAPQARLDDLLRRFAAGRQVDLLCVPADGRELEVLTSLDWSMHRPSIVMVKGARHDSIPTSWELVLLERSYTLAGDGAAQLFVAPEASDELEQLAQAIASGRFFDGYAQLEQENEELRVRLEVWVADDGVVGEADMVRTEAQFLNVQLHRAREEVALLQRSRALRAAARLRRALAPARDLDRRARVKAKTVFRHSLSVAGNLSSRLIPEHPSTAAAQLYEPGHAWSFAAGVPARLGADDDELAELVVAMERVLEHPDSASLESLRAACRALKLHSDEHVAWPGFRRDALCEADTAMRLLTSWPEGGGDPNGQERGATLVDGRCLQDHQYRGRGIGRHARAVLDAVVGTGDGGTTYLMVDPELPGLDDDVLALGVRVVAKHQVCQLDDVSRFVELSPMTADARSMSSLFLDDAVDRIAVVYDLIPFAHQQQYLPTALHRIQYLARLLVLSRYHRALVLSQTVGDAIARLGSRPSDWSVTGVAADLSAWRAEPLTTFLPRRFVVTAAGGDARKNLPAAVGALGVARTRGESDLSLVVYGSLPPSMQEEAVRLARRIGLPAESVVFMPALTEGQLRAVFERAHLSLVSSFDEGFSMPVAESLSVGTPVVASDIAAHRELVGDGWWLAEPRDTEGLGAAVVRGLEDRAGLAMAQRRALEDRADPAAVAARVRAGLLVTRPGRNGSALIARARSGFLRRPPRLALVTPWPPQLSGVADCSAYTVQALSKRADVCVFTAQPEASSGEAEFAPLGPDAYLDRGFDRVVTVMGNSPLHVPMLEYLADFGGACIAHDDRMIDIYSRRYGDRRTAAIMSTPGHGVAEEEIPGLLRNLDRLPNRCYELISQQAEPLIVHSATLAQQLLKETGVEPRVLPFLPHNVPASGRVDEAIVADARRRCRIEGDAFHIVTLGIVDLPTKGNDLIVHSLGWLDRWGIDAHLHILGSLSEELFYGLRRTAEEVGVKERVHLYGRYSRASHHSFLMAADVGVQLRLSPVLTISGAAADCAAFGLPTVASQTMADEMDLPSYVHRVPERITGLMLAESMSDILELRRNNLDRIEEERRDFVEAFSVERYADKLMAILGMDGGGVAH